MKNWAIRIVICATIILLVVGLAMVCRFYSPGVHTIGKAIHIEEFISLYVVGDSEERIDVAINGTYDGRPYNGGCGSFSGHMQVAGYPVPHYGAVGVISNNNRGLLCTQHGDYVVTTFYRSIVDVDDDGYAVSGDYSYCLVLNAKSPKEFMVLIYDKDHKQICAAANGEDQAEANRIYREYLDSL